jgi:hypothetical protein
MKELLRTASDGQKASESREIERQSLLCCFQ